MKNYVPKSPGTPVNQTLEIAVNRTHIENCDHSIPRRALSQEGQASGKALEGAVIHFSQPVMVFFNNRSE